MTEQSVQNPPFAGDLDRFRAAMEQAQELALEHLGAITDRPVSRMATWDDMRAALDEPLPETGTDPESAIAEWVERAAPGIVGSTGPRFFGWVIGGVTPAALGGDWLASALDQNAGVWGASPAAAQTETVVLRWLKELFGLPAEWAGAVTSGATMSNLVGLAAARQWASEQLGFNAAEDGLAGYPVIPVISSGDIHASARKALGTLGLGRNAVRTIPSIDGRLDLAAFDAELASIDGPVIVVGNAGEVNTGQFDDLNAIADRLEQRGPGWLHVDGAFGLFAGASPRFKHLVAGIERADSVAADGHKWLNVPYDSGFAFVRDEGILRSAFSASGAYLAPNAGDGPDPMHSVPEMSRRFRALAIWCALRADGRAGYQAMIERCIDNARSFADWVDRTAGIEIVNSAPLNIVSFRIAPPNLSDDAQDAFTRVTCRTMQENGKVFVSPTIWQGRPAIRAAFDHWATNAEDVELLEAEVLRAAGSDNRNSRA
ncbi:MAG: pyridoxal phosphate-dependent decarboxylase family protein [Thermomicrobiales bacterium]